MNGKFIPIDDIDTFKGKIPEYYDFIVFEKDEGPHGPNTIALSEVFYAHKFDGLFIEPQWGFISYIA
jgi:hypothetical protein